MQRGFGIHCAQLVFIAVLSTLPRVADNRRQDTSGKHCVINTHTDVINLKPLAGLDGKPRFTVDYAGMNFSFNPCQPFSNPDHLSQNQLLAVALPKDKHERRTKHIVLGSTNSVLYPKVSINVCHNPGKYHRITDTCPLGKLLATKDTDPVLNVSVSIPRNTTTHSSRKQTSASVTTTISHLVNVEDGEDENEQSSASLSSSDDEDVEHETPNEDFNFTSNFSTSHNTSRIKRDLHQEAPSNITAVLRFRSKGRCAGYRSYILLQCAPSLEEPNEAVFQILSAECNGHVYFMLSHRCCCEGLCPRPQDLDKSFTFARGRPLDAEVQPWLNDKDDSRFNESYDTHTFVMEVEEVKPKFMWLILLVNMAVIGSAICIATVCCRKGSMATTHGPYNYLPTLHSSRLTVASSMESCYQEKQVVPPKAAEYLDYSSPIANKNKLPQLSNCVIPAENLDIGQRLGGGLFGDTYLCEWKDRRVACKRLTVGVHQGQLNEQDHKWLTDEVTHLAKQRHKHLVAVFGVCLDSRQPYIISEYVECESLKDKLIKQSEEVFNWHKKLRTCIQIADGVAFLHSAKPAVLHRDLRCSNVLIDRYDKVKVVDYCVVKLLQRLRQGCNGRKECYCQKEHCALPASIRWTAPELLRNPQADEQANDLITPACDVYSYAMVLWEVASHCDPFEDIPDENEVSELVLDCVRPRVDILSSTIPQLRDLMAACWEDDRDQRPTFKQIAVHLKSCLQIITKMQHKPRNRNNSSTSYLKTALMA